MKFKEQQRLRKEELHKEYLRRNRMTKVKTKREQYKESGFVDVDTTQINPLKYKSVNDDAPIYHLVNMWNHINGTKSFYYKGESLGLLTTRVKKEGTNLFFKITIEPECISEEKQNN